MRPLFRAPGQFWNAQDFSADASQLLISRYVSINESYPGILDVTTGQKQMFTAPGKSTASFELLRFSPDSKSVLLATDVHSADHRPGAPKPRSPGCARRTRNAPIGIAR